MIRRPLLVLALSAFAAAPAHAAVHTFDVSATGHVEYLRTDDFPNPVKDTVEAYQATYDFRTDIPAVRFDRWELTSSGASTTAISAVRASEHGSDYLGGGGCTGTTGTVVPGSIEGAEVPSPDGAAPVFLRTMDMVTIPMGGCSGDLAANDLIIEPWNRTIPASAFDAYFTVGDEEMTGDVFTKDFHIAVAGAKCPGMVAPFTTRCSLAVEGVATFTRTEAAPTPTPTASPSASPSPSPSSTATPSPTIAPTPQPPAVRGRIVGGGRRVRVQVGCVLGCEGTITVTLPTGKVVLGRGTVDVAPGGTDTVDVTLSKAARRKVRRAGAVRVTIRTGTRTQTLKVRA